MTADPAVQAGLDALAKAGIAGVGPRCVGIILDAIRPIIEAEVYEALRNDQTNRQRARAAIAEAKADAENYMRIVRGRAAVRTEPER